MPGPPFKVKAIYEYTSLHDDDLHFLDGQIITVTEQEDDDWYSGKYIDDSGVLQEGIFPKNFVEKYEPTAPPRPTRASRPKKEIEPPLNATSEPSPSVAEPRLVDEAATIREHHQSTSNAPATISSSTVNLSKGSRPILNSTSSSTEPPQSQSLEKPSGNSFKDRIAAFNKAAPPVAPFKPSGLSSSFIKKPFVAPPPSKNAYVPLPRDQLTQKFYRREEDEIVAKECEHQQPADRVESTLSQNAVDENEPKPTSLRERIALLQKQQIEQASRHSDAAHKKERLKRPITKHTDLNTQIDTAEEGDCVSLERIGTGETAGKVSLDFARDESNLDRKRKSPTGAPTSPGTNSRENIGDGNEAEFPGAADDTTEPEDKEELYENPRSKPFTKASIGHTQDSDVVEGGRIMTTEPAEHDNEDDEDIDPEIKRKEELRARMAKMSGGMGMHGIFGPHGGMPMPIMIATSKKKRDNTNDKIPYEHKMEDSHLTASHAGPVPIIPTPIIAQSKSHESGHDEVTPYEDLAGIEDVNSHHEQADLPLVLPQAGDAPPIPGGRPALPVPKDSFPPAAIVPMSPGTGSESDDELSSGMQDPTFMSSAAHQYRSLQEHEGPSSPKSVHSKRESLIGADQASPTSPANPVANKRASRLPPPIPSGFASSQLQTRPPPPPPSASNLPSTSEKRPQSTYAPVLASEESEEVTEYEGDYDTDIVSTISHKDALKVHAKNNSIECNPSSSPVLLPSSLPSPLISSAAPRGNHPSPSHLASEFRSSVDMPRSAPPPPPPNGTSAPLEQDDEYDPYRYSAALTPKLDLDNTETDLYSASPPRSPYTTHEKKNQLPPREYTAPVNRAPPRNSVDVSRSATVTRRSVDLSRISLDSGFVANDVDLAPKSFWWIQPNGTPPVFQGRKDILFESEESPSSKNGKVMVTKELYVLFQDYSQTIFSTHFDPQNPADVKLEQRHEPPPSRLRQDQLEQAHESLGQRIFEGVTARKESVVGDGTPQGLIAELLKPLSNALLPIGTRAYGALVYGNIANASTQQNDEIRPGDLITLRNAKFQGKHGPLNAKYSMEVGKPDHVGVVAEWDGTKKKIRAWEQGRESKKVRLESFKLDDLRSGEVKIWRVMPRSWVGWEGQN